MFNVPYEPLSVDIFSGGIKGVGPGACGLFSIMGNCQLNPVIEAASILQYRGRTGAGLFLKGFYLDDEHYHFHIMYRDKNKIEELEKAMSSFGIQYLDKKTMAKESLYFEYDMPVFMSYTVLSPSEDIIKHKGGTGDLHEFIRDRVLWFNSRYKDQARIFSSSLNGANFSTAFELSDTIRIFDLENLNNKLLSGALVHMRWPTSQGQGLWWGAQPIVYGNMTGIHNGHLSSDKSNARALEQLGIPLQVGTDSEAIFQEIYWLIVNGFSLKEIEWIMSPKFPEEIHDLAEKEKEHYMRYITHPILRHFKMSGPSTAVINYGDLMLGITDRDHMRPFTIGYDKESVIFASEERAIINYSIITGKNYNILSPPAGKIVAFLAEWNSEVKKGVASIKHLEPDYVHINQGKNLSLENI